MPKHVHSLRRQLASWAPTACYRSQLWTGRSASILRVVRTSSDPPTYELEIDWAERVSVPFITTLPS